MAYTHPLISETTTDIWLTFWNTTFKAALEAGMASSAGWPVEFTGNGRLITESAADNAAEMTGSPSLNIVIPDGAQYVVDGVLHTADGDQTLGPISNNFTGWLVPVVTWNEISEVYDWTLVEHATRPALGSGVLGKVVTGASSVTSLDTSEAESDVIPKMPLLLQRLASASGEGATYWGTLVKNGSLAQTIEQYVTQAIATAVAGLGSNDPTEQPELSHLLRLAGVSMVGIAEVNPDATLRDEGTTIIPGVVDNDLVAGTATVDTVERVVGP